jgi:predicted Rdx family selenoprotein
MTVAAAGGVDGAGSAPELLIEIGEVALAPGTGGACDGVKIWDRKFDRGFPEAEILKQRVRGQLDPARDLGHVNRASWGGLEQPP